MKIINKIINLLGIKEIEDAKLKQNAYIIAIVTLAGIVGVNSLISIHILLDGLKNYSSVLFFNLLFFLIIFFLRTKKTKLAEIFLFWGMLFVIDLILGLNSGVFVSLIISIFSLMVLAGILMEPTHFRLYMVSALLGIVISGFISGWETLACPYFNCSAGIMWVDTLIVIISNASILRFVERHIASNLEVIKQKEGYYKHQEEELNSSNLRFRALFEGAQDPLLLLDPDYNIITCNKASADLLGFTNPADLLGKHPISISPEYQSDGVLSKAKITEVIEEIRKNGNALFEWTHIRTDGRLISVEVSVTRIEVEIGIMYLAHLRDITERSETTNRLKIISDNFKNIFELSPTPMVVTRIKEGSIVAEINRAYEEMFNVKRADMIGKASDLELTEEDRKRAFDEFAAKGRLKDFEININLPGRENKSYLVNSNIIDYNGEMCTLTVVADISQLRERELLLSQNEKRYRLLFESSSDAIFLMDKDIIIDCNTRACKLFNCEKSELLGYTYYSYSPPFQPDEMASKLKAENLIKSALMGSQQAFYWKHQDKHGDYFDAETVFTSFEISSKKYVQAVIRDITERKNFEEALIESNKRYETLGNATFEGVGLLENEMFKDLNPQLAELLGYEMSELLSKPYIDYVAPESKGFVLSVLRSNPQFLTFEYVALKKNDSRITVELRLKPVTIKGKQLYFIALRDITHRKRIEKALEDSKVFIEHIINSLPLALISFDDETNVTLSNKTSNLYLAENHINTNLLFDLYPMLNQVKNAILDSVNRKEVRLEAFSIIDDHSGDIKNYNITVFPLEKAEGKGNTILIEDITLKRNMEQLMIQSEKMASIAGLAAGMAHEINNPLGTIVQGCQNIIRRTSNELEKNLEAADKVGITIEQLNEYMTEREIFRILSSVKNAASKAHEIIRNMLQFSRNSESKKIEYNINDLLNETVDIAYNDYNLKKKYDFRQIEIVKEYQSNLPLMRLTVTEIQQVVFNMLTNSAQAMKTENHPLKKPVITIRSILENEAIIIEIEDNGPGMSEKARNRAFEPFFTTKEVGEGTGLGLSVSYMIVRNNHYGDIKIISKPGKGTTMRISLPIKGE